MKRKSLIVAIHLYNIQNCCYIKMLAYAKCMIISINDIVAVIK